MQLPPASATTSFSIPSANSSSDKLSGGSGVDEYGNMSTYAGHPSSSVSIATSGVREKKTSVLSLGLPSLLKSSSRRSLHSDGSKDSKDGLKSPKERKAEAKAEAKEAAKKSGDEKEGRLSVLMGRKRGKVSVSLLPFGVLLLFRLGRFTGDVSCCWIVSIIGCLATLLSTALALLRLRDSFVTCADLCLH